MSFFCSPSYQGGIIVTPSVCGASCQANRNDGFIRIEHPGDGSDPPPVELGPYQQGVLVIHNGNVGDILKGELQVISDSTGESYMADSCQWLVFHQENYGTGYTYTYRTEGGSGTDCTTLETKAYKEQSVSGQIPPPPLSATLYLNLLEDI